MEHYAIVSVFEAFHTNYLVTCWHLLIDRLVTMVTCIVGCTSDFIYLFIVLVKLVRHSSLFLALAR